MIHMGDISRVNGAELEPVDIITFGSPCQDWSVAGNREGIKGKRSGLFWEAVRVIGEMLAATGGEYPKAIIFENVPGLLSSDVKKRGKQKDYTQSDFAVALRALQDLGFVLDPNILDAQYMGVPQRRRRVFVAGINANYIERWPEYNAQQGQANADSTGQPRFFGVSHDSGDNIVRLRACAIALERYLSTQRAGSLYTVGESVSRDNTPCEETREGIAGTAADCVSGADTEITQSGVMVWPDVAGTLISRGDSSPCVDRGQPFVAALYENHAQDCRVTGPLDTSQTVSQKWGTGGNNTPIVAAVHQNQCGEVRLGDVAYTVNTNGNASGRNAPIVALTNRGNYSSEVTETIRAESHGAVPMVAAFMAGQGAKAGSIAYSEIAPPTLKSTGGNAAPTVCYGYQAYGEYKETDTAKTILSCDDITTGDSVTIAVRHIIRRLMPCECLKLQGFPPDWCDGVGITEPSETDIHRWSKVFEAKRLIANPTGKKGEPTKPKSRNQIIKWLKNPYSDSAVYRAAGNSAALPCVRFVMARVKLALERMESI